MLQVAAAGQATATRTVKETSRPHHNLPPLPEEPQTNQLPHHGEENLLMKNNFVMTDKKDGTFDPSFFVLAVNRVQTV